MKNNDMKFFTKWIFIGFAIINIPFIINLFKINKFDPETIGQYGAFIGGYIGPLFTFLSVILLYMTLKNQMDSFRLEKFENNFFELLKLHRENVNEIGIKNSYGRKVFVSMIREFREIYIRTNSFLESKHCNIKNDVRINISYLILFYGTGPNSSRVLKKALKNKIDEEMIKGLISLFDDSNLKEAVKKDRRFHYCPFEGHQSRLGHYYRHLYQMIRFVHDNENLNHTEKYKYIKMIRAQLSTHEQALLFLNSLSDMGINWERQGLISTYKLIKNLPNHFFDDAEEIDIKSYYPNLEFEWELM